MQSSKRKRAGADSIEGLPLSSRSIESYEKLAQVGEGNYGKVYKAICKETNRIVALKKIRMEREREGFPVTATREIKLLFALHSGNAAADGVCENIVYLIEIITSEDSIYLVFEYLDHDLSGILRHPTAILSTAHITYIMYQLLKALECLHDKNIIHRDIKGSNLLLGKNGNLKLADFGLARSMVPEKDSIPMTNRVITIYYRAPELLLGQHYYGTEVDIWSAGCILAEMFLKKPLFPGMDEISQLDKISHLLGTNGVLYWDGIETLPWYELMYKDPRRPSQENTKHPNLRDYLQGLMPDLALDLVVKMLTLNPAKRITAKEALKHRLFEELESWECNQIPEFNFIEGDWHEFESKQRRKKDIADVPSTVSVPVTSSIVNV